MYINQIKINDIIKLTAFICINMSEEFNSSGIKNLSH